MDAPDLIIPVRFQYAGAAQDLRNFAEQSQQAAQQEATVRTRVANDTERHRREVAKETAAMLRQVEKEQAADKKQAAKDAFAAWKEVQDQQHREAMQAWKEEQAGIRQAKKDEVQVAKDAAALLNQIERDQAKDAAKAAKDAEAAKKQAAKDEFAAWKEVQDQRHREAMQDYKEEQAAAKQAEKEKVQVAKDASALLKQIERDEARDAAQAKKDEVRAAKDAEAAKTQAAKDAFAKWKAAQDVQHRQAMQSWEEQRAATKQAEAEAKSFENQILAVTKAMVGMSTVRAVIGAITDLMKEAAEYTRNIAKDFVNLRRTMQEVATLSGKQNNNQFTLELAKEAQAAHLNPEEYRDFQAQFLNYAGSQVSSDEKIGEGQKLTASQGKEFSARVAEMMKASGINPSVGAELSGMMLEQSQGPQDVNNLMSRFGKVFQVLEKGRVPLSKALPELSQIVSMGVSPEEAARMYSIVSPAAAGSEGTSVQAALRAVREMKAKGSGAEFGVRAGMSQYESVKAFAENINQRRLGLMAGGKTEQEAEDEVQKQLMEKQVAMDYRESRGLVAGFGRMGVQLGGFRRFEAIEAATPADLEIRRRKDYEASDAGQQAKRDADEAVANAERGEANSKVAEIMQEARTALVKEGRFERVDAEDYARKAIERVGGPTRNEQLVNERAIEIARQKYGRPDDDNLVTTFGIGNQQTNEKILAAVRNAKDKKDEELLQVQRRMLQLMEQQAARENGNSSPPLGAPPPMPGPGRRN